VADFGIAKTVEGVDLTTTGILVGTPGYLAPERVAGQAAKPSSDLYSVGVLLYEALSGRKPFEADSPLALAHAIQNRPPVPLAELRPDIPSHVVAVVERAMEKDPVRRFADASEMARALQQTPARPGVVSATERLSSTRAFASTTLHRAWRTAERVGPQVARRMGRFPVAALVVVAAVLVFALVAVTSRDSREPVIGPTRSSGSEASSILGPEVTAIRSAVEAGDRDDATERLAELRSTVAELRATGALSGAGADRILAAASDVEAKLALLPSESEPPVVGGGRDDRAPKTATTERQRGRGNANDDDDHDEEEDD
jgi:hypothetical protein